MRKYINAEAMQHSMKLIQMGAKVNQVNSKMCYVTFQVGKIELEYVYNINGKGQYFLERIKPYPLPMKVYEKEEDLIDIIEIDVEQFKNATKSHNIDEFICINSKLNETIKKFEDLFLYYNVAEIEAKNIVAKIYEIQDIIKETKEASERVYFRKDPDNI